MKPLIASLVLVAPFALAVSPGVRAADLQQVYQRAVENDPRLQEALAANRAAHYERPLARGALLPQLGLAASLNRNRRDDQVRDATTYDTGKSYTLALTQPLYHRDSWVALDLADATIGQSDAELAAAEQDLIVRTAEAYFGVLSAQADLEFATANLAASARQLEQAKKRFEVGMTAVTDVHEAQAAYDIAAAQEIAAHNAVDSARAALAEIIGSDEGLNALADLIADVPLPGPDPEDMDAWRKTALDNNPAVAAARYAAEAARQGVETARAGHYPTLDLIARYGYLNQSLGGLFSLERYDANIGLELQVPLYTGGQVSAATEQARANLEQARQGLTQALRAAERQVSDAYRGVITGINQVHALEQAIVSNQSALEATTAGYEVGTRTLVDVLVGQRNLFSARRDYAKARYDYLLNTLRLKQAAGILSAADVEAIERWLQ